MTTLTLGQEFVIVLVYGFICLGIGIFIGLKKDEIKRRIKE